MCGYSHGAYASCHAVQERNWRADWEAEARMFAPAPKSEPVPETAPAPLDESAE
jgi:hypothetical protein